ncbi:tellurite resistance protein TerC [Andreprevotia lacus DSM 23236]|uniref:Tellurite resistance protein TerC n=1 Tax=Andreprevotia lacus DSM 23236 TaxID=1121001 RepID=A0A1W1XKM8_9NEIS|nr:TerC family protein [Andreprevotia lacus]SMC24392.1 tellurite resistance protein TerC [Andreprevotia lacus DSM 23236]
MIDLWTWGIFAIVVVVLLVFDLGILHKDDHEIGIAESLKLSAFYITAGLLFGGYVWWLKGPQAGLDYYTGFLVEKSLSMDNVFVISLIFTSLAIPRQYQHRVLFWGILGAIVMRALMIGVGAALVHQFSWILLIFGGFLLFTGVKMLFAKDEETDITQSGMFRFFKRHIRLADQLHGSRFVVRGEDEGLKPGRWFTPLFLALLMVEGADLVFAVDSIPAIFAITQDPFIVYTSNIFAILGLRALYFALAAMVHRFHYLKYALAVVLIFIGVKIGLVYMEIKIPSLVSLTVTFGLLLAGVLYSLHKTRGEAVATSK